MPASALTIRSDLKPGDLGRVIALHGTAYEGETVHSGLKFEAYVAKTIAEFVIDNGARGKVFLAERGPDLVGCAAMVERRDDAASHGQLRWVLADPSARGLGLGRRFVEPTCPFGGGVCFIRFARPAASGDSGKSCGQNSR